MKSNNSDPNLLNKFLAALSELKPRPKPRNKFMSELAVTAPHILERLQSGVPIDEIATAIGVVYGFRVKPATLGRILRNPKFGRPKTRKRGNDGQRHLNLDENGGAS